MDLLEIPFTDWYKNLKPKEKDEMDIILSGMCNVSLATVRAWGLGYRTPKSRSQERITEYFKGQNIYADSITLFPS